MKYIIVFMIALVSVMGCSSEEKSLPEQSKESSFDTYRMKRKNESYEKRLEYEKGINSDLDEILNSTEYQIVFENHEDISRIGGDEIEYLMEKVEQLKRRFLYFNVEKNVYNSIYIDDIADSDIDKKIKDMDERVSFIEKESKDKIFVLESVFIKYAGKKWADNLFEELKLRSVAYQKYFNCRNEALKDALNSSDERSKSIEEYIDETCLEHKIRLDNYAEGHRSKIESSRRSRSQRAVEGKRH